MTPESRILRNLQIAAKVDVFGCDKTTTTAELYGNFEATSTPCYIFSLKRKIEERDEAGRTGSSKCNRRCAGGILRRGSWVKVVQSNKQTVCLRAYVLEVFRRHCRTDLFLSLPALVIPYVPLQIIHERGAPCFREGLAGV